MSETQQLDLSILSTKKIDSVEDYQFEPIKGYPMLNWKGKRPFISTQYYPAQLKERHGNEVNGWINKIFWGDNLQVMSHLLKEFRGKVNLVYIDPPFDSKADYKKKISLKAKQVTNDQSTFEEKQYTDIWSNDEYLQFMYERLVLIRELLNEDGSIYLHCDYRKSHHIRMILEEIFGNNLKNEIIWKRTSARSDSNKFNHIHDSIYLFSKGEKFTFNELHLPHTREYIDNYFTYHEENGRRFATIDATQSGITYGDSGKPWRGFDPTTKGNHWKFTIGKLEELNSQGRIYWPKKEGGWPRLKSYLDEQKGAAIQALWTDIKAVNSQAKERLTYPTQKPEELLERMIKASSNPGDIVFDCFMGSGTTQAVAMKLGRRFIGADINLGAAQTTTKRLLQIASELNQQKQQQELEVTEEEPITHYTGFEVYNVNHYDIFRNPIQAKELLLETLEVQKLEQGNLFDGEKDGRMIKIMPINRIATRTDLNELISGFDYKAFEKRQTDAPNKPVEKITLVCMGHETDLGDKLKAEVLPYKIDVEVVDILRDRQDIQFKRDSEAKIVIKSKYLVIEKFYPMNLLQKLSMEQESVEDWRELVESIMIDWNYDGAILEPTLVDIPDKNELVQGKYQIPADAGKIRIKITDLLSESLEQEVQNG